ncbi:MAG: MerC domain-containing protein [Pseudomonadota bacterium]
MLEPVKHTRADIVGMLLSFICMLHCLLLPLIVVLGIAGERWLLNDEWAHIVMLGFVIPISGVALIGGWLRHRRMTVIALGLVGVVLLAVAALVLHDHAGVWADAAVTTIGGGLLAVAHWRNRRCGCAGKTGLAAA